MLVHLMVSQTPSVVKEIHALFENDMLMNFGDDQASTVTPGAMCTPDVAMASTYGIPLASSLARFILVLLRPISTSLGRGGWLFVLRRSFITLRWLRMGTMSRVRCRVILRLSASE
jgi:hypothetical protein